jgi:hypothetical protein
LLGNFELNRPTCFLLNHRRSVSHPAADTHVIGLQPDEITTPKFAIDSKVEQREVTFSPSNWSRTRMVQTSLGFNGRF